MANEPIAEPLTAAQFLNHVRSTLDASLQRWEFKNGPECVTHDHQDYYLVTVRFLGTGRIALIAAGGDEWTAEEDGEENPWLTARLSGHVRDDSGVLREAAKC